MIKEGEKRMIGGERRMIKEWYKKDDNRGDREKSSIIKEGIEIEEDDKVYRDREKRKIKEGRKGKG